MARAIKIEKGGAEYRTIINNDDDVEFSELEGGEDLKVEKGMCNPNFIVTTVSAGNQSTISHPLAIIIATLTSSTCSSSGAVYIVTQTPNTRNLYGVNLQGLHRCRMRAT